MLQHNQALLSLLSMAHLWDAEEDDRAGLDR
jgi:hypothetical protein